MFLSPIAAFGDGYGVNKTRFPLKTCGNDKQIGFSGKFIWELST